jgi:cell wall-associated NlpC family hydrolase
MTLPEPSEFARTKAAQLVALARQMEGAHYVWGATGDIAGHTWYAGSGELNGMPREIDDTHRLSNRVVQMLDSQPNLAEEPTSRHRRPPPLPEEMNLFAACTNIHFQTVCCGRCAVAHGELAMPSRRNIDLERLRELAQAPERCLWPRSYRRGEGRADAEPILANGESCLWKRHFDCVGFIGFCIWRITGARHQRSILQWIKAPLREMETIQAFDGPPLDPFDIRPGDLIITPPHNHIAFATGLGRVMEAQSEEHGVCHNVISLTGKIVRRFTDRFWAGLT